MNSPSWHLFGLDVQSEIELPGDPSASSGPADVSVRFGELPPTGQSVSVLPDGGFQIEVRNVARYRVKGGREIIVDRAAGASDRNLRAFLLGSAMGALLHQRQRLPLHANAVVIDGRAIAFMGPSGSGKSTLAAWFQARGFQLLADDVLAIADPGAGPVALSGVQRLRLWSDALDMIAPSGGPFERSFDGEDKFDVPICRPARSARLHACYILDKRPGPALEIEPLRGLAALEALIANTYRGAFLKLIGSPVNHMGQCIGLAGQVRMNRVKRCDDLGGFDRFASAILDHVGNALTADPTPVQGQGAVCLSAAHN